MKSESKILQSTVSAGCHTEIRVIKKKNKSKWKEKRVRVGVGGCMELQSV